MPDAWSNKREREYENLKQEFEEEGRYEGREEEVAARIVNKQRAEFGETKAAKQQDREGNSPDRALPINHYDHLTVDQVKPKLDDLSDREVDAIGKYEEDHKHRKTLLEAIGERRQD